MTENPTEKLEACPFCKTKGATVCQLTDVFYTECSSRKCCALGPEAPSEAEAIAAWNTRPPAGDGEAV